MRLTGLLSGRARSRTQTAGALAGLGLGEQAVLQKRRDRDPGLV